MYEVGDVLRIFDDEYDVINVSGEKAKIIGRSTKAIYTIPSTAPVVVTKASKLFAKRGYFFPLKDAHKSAAYSSHGLANEESKDVRLSRAACHQLLDVHGGCGNSDYYVVEAFPGTNMVKIHHEAGERPVEMRFLNLRSNEKVLTVPEGKPKKPRAKRS